MFMILEFISDPAQSHHSKAHGNCCNKQTPTTHKDAKDTKTKKPNWSIKFNCTKLKGKQIFFFIIINFIAYEFKEIFI